MNIEYIKNPIEFDEFLKSQKNSQFLQSFSWGEFNEKLGANVYHLAVKQSNKIVAAALIIKKELPIGKNYLYCPKGPIFGFRISDVGSQISKVLFEEIKKIAVDDKAIFLRFEPDENLYKNLENSDWKIEKTIDVQPSKTMVLDLNKSEDEILKGMSQKTRYNIRLAEKKGVKIIEAGMDRFEDFWKLMGETKDRDNFRLHGLDYYRAMLEIGNGLKLFFAEYETKKIAAAIISIFGDSVSYLHGASSNENRQVMAPHLLQWEMIKLAKQNGAVIYDFNGIDENKWPGVTKFKKGFGGREVNFPGTFDLIFDSGWYGIYKMIRRARRTF